MYKLELISIGNELLNGFTLNSNASWLGQKMTQLGYAVNWVTTISDEKKDLEDSFEHAAGRADIVLVTGGLGPTHDDITKSVITSFFDLPLELNKKALKNVESFFKRRNRPISDLGKMQALIPKDAKVLTNSIGTASGIGIKYKRTQFIFMPGVPSEMKNIMNGEGFDFILQNYKTKPNLIFNFKTTGIYESLLSEKIITLIETADPQIRIAFLPKITGVTVRISAPAVRKKEAAILADKIREKIGKYIFSETDENLETVVGRLLIEKKMTVSLAESCTGGLLSHLLTNVPGSSAFTIYNQVTYSNEAKVKQLGVPEDVLFDHGAVSEAVAKRMAENSCKSVGTDFGIGITGIAGPEGGTIDKPVGLVYIALARKGKKAEVKKFQFGNNREINKLQTAVAAMEILRRELLRESQKK